ncbi:MAG: peptidoglycan-binding domain-containing protein [Limimaricola soesokkakensis]|uniref:peptidoglycan-binding domain-containing protein n=1 Tax=Limimaricola soesokkakensis TaxID=1343159 RepID=UPI00405985F5
MIYADAIHNAQSVLAVWAGYAGTIDGVIGDLTRGAVARTGHQAPTWWGPSRQVIGAMQYALTRMGQDPGPIDGLYGPQTDAAFRLWHHRHHRGADWRRPDYAKATGAGGRWGTEATIDALFGPPGGPRCTAGRVSVPWRMVLAWDPLAEIEDIACHEDVAPSLARVFEQVADTHTPDEIQDLGLGIYGGCYNYRRKRGGSEWSTHAWGVSLDFDPVRNRLNWGADRARLARPAADRWWAAWAAEGWTSLGQVGNFDWMHVQAPAR